MALCCKQVPGSNLNLRPKGMVFTYITLDLFSGISQIDCHSKQHYLFFRKGKRYFPLVLRLSKWWNMLIVRFFFDSDFCFCFSDTPAHMYYLHTCCWVLNMFGIFFILAAHEHYSIDVVIAFYITSRLFLYYHTLANTLALKRIESRRSRVWFPLFWFFEEKVSGKVPNEYEWPLKKPAFLCSKQKSTWMIFLWKWDISPFQCLWHTYNGDVKMLCSCKCWLGVFFIQPLILTCI